MRVFVAHSSLFTTLPQSAVFTQTKQLFMSTLGVFLFTFTLSHRKRSSTSSNSSNFQSCLLQRIDCYLGTAMRSSGMEEKGRRDQTSIFKQFLLTPSGALSIMMMHHLCHISHTVHCATCKQTYWATQCDNYHMAEPTHVSKCPCLILLKS